MALKIELINKSFFEKRSGPCPLRWYVNINPLRGCNKGNSSADQPVGVVDCGRRKYVVSVLHRYKIRFDDSKVVVNILWANKKVYKFSRTRLR